MFIVTVFIIHRIWPQLTDPLVDEWIIKMWYVYTMEHSLYSYYNGKYDICKQMNIVRNNHSSVDTFYNVLNFI